MQVFVRYGVKLLQSISAATSGELYVLSYLDSKCDHHRFSRLFAFVLRAFSEFSLQFDVYFPTLASNVRTLNEISIQYLYVQ